MLVRATVNEHLWKPDDLTVLDGMLAARWNMALIQQKMWLRMGWRPTVAQIREAEAMLEEQRRVAKDE